MEIIIFNQEKFDVVLVGNGNWSFVNELIKKLDK